MDQPVRSSHPGDILREEFLGPLGMTPYRLAKGLGVSQTAVSAILKGRRSVTAPMALRLARFRDISPRFRPSLPAAYDLVKASRSLEGQLKAIGPYERAAWSQPGGRIESGPRGFGSAHGLGRVRALSAQ